MKNILIFTMCIIISGCVNHYVTPKSGPTAKLKIVTEYSGINMPVRHYEADNCADWPGKQLARLNSKVIGETFNPEANATIEANRNFIISVYAMTTQNVISTPGNGTGLGVQLGWCAPVVNFFPKAGGEYVAYHKADPSKCTITIYQIDQSTKKMVLEQSARIQNSCPQNLQQ